MQQRNIQIIMNEIYHYEGTIAQDEKFEPKRLSLLAKAYIDLGKEDKTQQQNCFEKALNYLNMAILQDKDDFDPVIVAERTELFIHIINSGLVLKNTNGELLDIHSLLENDKTLLEEGMKKVKGVSKLFVRNTLEKVNKQLSLNAPAENKDNVSENLIPENVDNNTNSILRKLGHNRKKVTTELDLKSDSIVLSNSNSSDPEDDFGLVDNKRLRRENLELKEEIKKLKNLVTFLQEENKKFHLETSVEDNELSACYRPGKNP